MSAQLSRRSFLRLLPLLPMIGIGPDRSAKPQAPHPPEQQKLPNIIVFLFDALSAAHLPLYGYHRNTAPNLSRMAQSATVYHAHHAAGNYTTPGTASLLTGTYPWTHRALHLWGTMTKSQVGRDLFTLVGGDRLSLAYTHNWFCQILLEQLRSSVDVLPDPGELLLSDENVLSKQVSDDGFATALWAEAELFHGAAGERWREMPASLFLSVIRRAWAEARRRDLERKFGREFPRGLPGRAGYPMSFLLEHAIDWLAQQLDNLATPFVAYFHVLPPHDPYHPRREFVGAFDGSWSPPAKEPHFFSQGYPADDLARRRLEYDETIAYADAEFGRLYDHLIRSQVLAHSYLVVTSDHGEMFERGIWGHLTPTLYEPILRVPLLVSRPSQHTRADVYSPTCCVDLLPSLLHAAGKPIPSWCEGRILPGFPGCEAAVERSIYAVEAKSNPKEGPLRKGTLAVLRGDYKLVRYFGYPNHDGVHELYNLAQDPDETNNLYADGSPIAAELAHDAEAKIAQVNAPYLHH